MLEGKKVSLRVLENKDLSKIEEWGQNPEVSQYLNGSYKKEILEASKEKPNDMLKKRNTRVFAIEVNKKLIGHVKLDQIIWRKRNAELSICIGDKDYWGSGYGSDAIYTILNYAFEKMNLDYIYLRVCGYNKRAIKCYKKCGFHKEAILKNAVEFKGKDYDIYLMQVSHDIFHKKFNMIYKDHLTRRDKEQIKYKCQCL